MSETVDGTKLSRRLEDNQAKLAAELGIGTSFDVLWRDLTVGGKDAALVFIDGFANSLVLTPVLARLTAAERPDLSVDAVQKVLRAHLPHVEVDVVTTFEELVAEVLAGPQALLIDGCDQALIIDAREYPVRSPEEPDLERVVRGSRDGFVETLIFNVTLVRRRVRDPRLRVELVTVGRRSRTDVAVLYLQDVAQPSLPREVKQRIQDIAVDGIPMGEKALEEFITRKDKAFWNPFPTVRYTERPDVAAVHLFEGHVVVIVDTSPSAIILPATAFHHLQHAEEFRQDPVVGAYLRWVRLLGQFLAWLLPPLWLAAAIDPHILPEFLEFIGPEEPGRIPIGIQFIFADMGVDLIRLALIHTPDALATALGFIGAILLGDMAARIGLLAPETIIYVALSAVGTFATPSMEFGLSIRLVRLSLIVAVAIFGAWGLLLFPLQLLLLMFMRSFGVPYLYPLIPFKPRELWGVLWRSPVHARKLRPSLLHPQDPDKAPRGEAK